MTNTTRKARTTKAQIVAPIDLSEYPGTYPESTYNPLAARRAGAEAAQSLIEELAARDDVIVDLWSDDTPGLVFLSEEAVVEIHGDVDAVIDAVARRLHMGWGREGALLDGMDVERLDGRAPLEADVTARTIFRPHVAGRTASWRLVENAIGEPVAR